MPVSLLSLGLEGKAKEEYSPINYVVVLGQFHTRQINNRWMEEDTTIEMLGKTVRTMGMDEWMVGWLVGWLVGWVVCILTQTDRGIHH